MDALSDVLKSVRLEGAVYLNAEFTAPWCVRAKFGLAKARAGMAGADYVVFFHFIVDGGCKVRVGDGDVLVAGAHDLVIFPQEELHVMGSDVHLAPVEASSLIDPKAARDTSLFQLRHGGGGEATHVVCGFLATPRGVSILGRASKKRVVNVGQKGGLTAVLVLV